MRKLCDELERTGAVSGGPDQVELVRRVARQVAISDEEAEKELNTPGGLHRLIVEERKRIREGSRRLMRAMNQAQKRLDAGDSTGARQAYHEAIATEVVPFYREIAEAELRKLRS